MEEAEDVEVAVGVGVALAFALAVGLGVELAFAVAVALAVGVAVGLASAADSAWVEAFGLAVELALVLGVGLADEVGLAVADDLVLVLDAVADGLAVPLALGDAEVVGVGTGVWYACSRYTGRKAILAVVEIRLMTDDAAWPGTVTSSRSLPICWTWAPELPVPFTRDSRTDWASCIAPADGAPFSVAACSTTWVPLDRSSPSLTWKVWPFHLPGLNVWLPVIVKNMIRIRTASAASVRPG